MRVRKAVIPAAGLGTRCLPLTKAVPKELLPIFNLPAIQRIAEEAVDSGLDTIVLVTGPDKAAIEHHFESNARLERRLATRPDLLESVQRPASLCQIATAPQDEPLGLGHAVGCAAEAVGNEPFAVMLPDDLVLGLQPALAPLLALYEATGKGVVLLMDVPREDTARYGVVDGDIDEKGVVHIRGLVEKPKPEEAPSTLAIVGRYVFPPSIFDRIRETTPGALGEIQLTDAMQGLAQEEGMLGLMIEGIRLDTGTPLGLLRAALHYAVAEDADHLEQIQKWVAELSP